MVDVHRTRFAPSCVLYIFCTVRWCFRTWSHSQALPQCVAGIRNMHNQCPKEVLSFLWDLFKYSDNQMNKVKRRARLHPLRE